MSSQKKHLNIVSGFLGSGKTTAILRYISENQLRERILVLINEFGENNIDGSEFELKNWGRHYTTWHIPGGCICCVSKMVLTKKLLEAAKSNLFDRVIIEPSGLARASDIIDMIDKSSLKTSFHIHPVICLVNPAMTSDGHSVRAPIVWDQIEASDIIVSNFTDTTSLSEKIKLESQIKQIKPAKMDLIFTVNGEINSEVLNMNYPVYKFHKKIQTAGTSTEGFASKSYKWERSEVFDLLGLIKFFNELKMNTSIVRGKGYFNTNKGWIRVDIANGEFHKRSSEYRADSRMDFHCFDNELANSIVEKALGLLNGSELMDSHHNYLLS